MKNATWVLPPRRGVGCNVKRNYNDCYRCSLSQGREKCFCIWCMAASQLVMLYVRVFYFSSAGWKAFLNALRGCWICLPALQNPIRNLPFTPWKLFGLQTAAQGREKCIAAILQHLEKVPALYFSLSSLVVGISHYGTRCLVTSIRQLFDTMVLLEGAESAPFPLQPPALMLFSLKPAAFVLVIALEFEIKGRYIVASMGSAMMGIMPLAFRAALYMVPPMDWYSSCLVSAGQVEIMGNWEEQAFSLQWQTQRWMNLRCFQM